MAIDLLKYAYPAIRIEAWDSDGTPYTLMDTIDGSSSKNYTISTNVSRHLNDRIGSFSCRIENNNGKFLNTFTGGEDIEIYVDYDTSIDENLYDNLTNFWNFNTDLKDSVGNSFFINRINLLLEFSGNATDSSINGNNATNYGATIIDDRFSTSNDAYYFNGTNVQYMTHPTTGLSASEGTIMIWFKPSDVVIDKILYANEQTTGQQIAIGVNTSGNLYAYIGDSAQLIGATDLVADTYYCAILSWNATTANLYLNGYNDIDETTIIGPTTMDSMHYIAGNKFVGVSSAKSFQGNIDSIVWFNTDIDGASINKMYILLAGSKGIYNSPTPLTRRIEATAYYPLDGKGTDASVNGRDATIRTDLIAHYKMNDDGATTNIIDNKGNYTGNSISNASAISTTGHINNAIVLNGSSEYISLDGGVDTSAYHFTTDTTLEVKHNLDKQYNHFIVYGTAGEVIEPETASMDSENQMTVYIESPSPTYVKVYNTEKFEDVNDGYTYLHEQTVSTSAWTVSHELDDSYPAFTVFDNDSNVVEPVSATITDADTMVVNFDAPILGYVEVVTGATANKYLHTQSSASTSWTVNHSLGDSRPFVSAFDSNGNPVKVESITVTDSDNIAIETSVSTTGYARVIVNDYDDLAGGIGTDFTMSSWVEVTGTTAHGAIFSVSASDNTHKLTIGVSSTGYPYVKEPAGTFSGSTRVDDGDYHLIVFDFNDTTDAYNLYVDEATAISSSYNMTIAGTDKVSIGQEYTGGGTPSNFFNGVIDDTRVYKAAVLSRVRDNIYNSGDGTETENLDGAQPAINRFGEAGKAMSFYNINDYISVLTDFPQHTNNCTFLAWVKLEGGSVYGIMGNRWYFAVNSSGKITFYDGGTGYFLSSPFDSLYTSASTGWHQVGFMIDSGRFFFIQDGEKSSDQGACSLTWTSSELAIGDTSNQLGHWRGEIDEVVVIDDVLSDSLIEDFYNYTAAHDLNKPYVTGVQNTGFDMSGLKDFLYGNITIDKDNGAVSAWYKDVYVGEGDAYLFSSDVNSGTYIKVISDNVISIIINEQTIIANLALTAGEYNHIVVTWKLSKAQVYLNGEDQTGTVAF